MDDTRTPDAGGPRPGATSHGRIEMDTDELEIEVEVERPRGVRGRAGKGIDRAAEAVRRKAWEAEGKGGAAGRTAPAAHRIADDLGGAADYVRTHEFGEMRDDFEYNVREHPIRSVLLAGALGFVFGKILR